MNRTEERLLKTEVLGTQIHYELMGQGEKRVVLLHGWGCSTKLMQPVAQALSEDMTVLLVDFPAHGESDRPPEPWGVPEFAECTLKLLEELSFLPCSVIAHSFGGRVTLELAARAHNENRRLFEKIVLTGAAGLRAPASNEKSKRTKQYQQLKKAVRAFGNLPLCSGAAKKMEEALLKKYGSPDYVALDEEMRKTFVKVINHNQESLLPLVDSPTLLVWGDQDTETPLWMGRKMEKDIPDAGLVIFEGGTHFAYLEQVGRFNAIVRNFFGLDG